MIDLSKPARTVQGVTVFGDHADPKLFHYIPVQPRLATDSNGHPELTLFKYHLDPAVQNATGAALFELTVDLAVDADTLAQVHDKVASAAGTTGITLAPIWADSGTCQLILLDSGPSASTAATTTTPAAPASTADAPAAALPAATPAAAPPASSMVQNVLGGATPDLASNATTMFAATLDPSGSAIVEQALRQGGLPFGVVYNLQTSGLRPALSASITADYRSCYHYYENRLHGGRLLFATDVGATVQDLVQQQALKVTVDDLVPDADKDGIYQQALDQVQQYVLQTLFTPTISQTPPAQDSGGSIASVISGLVGMFTITYSLRTVDDSELKTLSYSLAVAQAETITLAPQAILSAILPPGLAPDTVIIAVDPAPPDQLNVDVGCLVDLAAEAIDHLDVTLSYAGADTLVRLDAGLERKTQPIWYSAAAGTEVSYTYEAQLAATGPKGLSGVVTGGKGTSVHDVVLLDPRELYQRVELRPVLQGVPADHYPQVIVDVQASEALDGWTVTDTVQLGATCSDATVAYRGRRDGLITLRTRVRYVDTSGTETTKGWRDTDPGPLVIGNPDAAVQVVDLVASARFGTVVARIVVELRSDANPDAVTPLTFDATTTSSTWTYVPSTAAPGYHYRVTVQDLDGSVRPGDWLAGSDDPTLVVGEGFSQLRTVEVVFLGGTLATAGKLAAKVRLTTAPGATGPGADQEFLVQDPIAPITWTYPVADPANEAYTMTVTWINADGTSTQDTPRTGSELLQVVVVGT